MEWTLPAGSEPPVETEVQYGYRRKGTWKNAMRLEGEAIACTIGGLNPGKEYVVRVRTRGRHGGGWSSWAKSAPVSTAEEQAGGTAALAEDEGACLERMYEALFLATEEGEDPAPDALSEVVGCITAYGTLSGECMDFLLETLGSDGSTVLLKGMRVLGTLLQGSGGCGEFRAAAQRSEALLARLSELGQFSCEPHPTHGTKPQEMVRTVSTALRSQVAAAAPEPKKGGLGKLGRGLADKAKAAADKALAAAEAAQAAQAAPAPALQHFLATGARSRLPAAALAALS
jgi:hypothetical protein